MFAQLTFFRHLWYNREQFEGDIMDNNQIIINENINLEEIISIINLMGLISNIKHIDLKYINFECKIY